MSECYHGYRLPGIFFCEYCMYRLYIGPMSHFYIPMELVLSGS